MPMIHVVKQFMLQLDPKRVGGTDEHPQMSIPELIHYPVGIHDVSDEVANHWYVAYHLAGYVEPPPKPGTAEYHVSDVVTSQPIDPATLPETSQPAPQEAATRPRMAALPPTATRSIPRPSGLAQGFAQPVVEPTPTPPQTNE